MVIDSSAIVAAITHEPGNMAYRDAIKTAPIRLISAVTLLETRIVLFARLGPLAVATLSELIERAEIAVVPFDETLADAAFEAFRRYGRGQGSAARLNIIDCVAYALARSRDLPLLYKGVDFAHTDVQSALGAGG
ncbi:MAG TPA: type II toxin-antitoxin system VapC family toxin [Stellaceae bacterium]|nr:type II toxin-antitoxin system VapC family toxin [Stellaceae bacterium]